MTDISQNLKTAAVLMSKKCMPRDWELSGSWYGRPFNFGLWYWPKHWPRPMVRTLDLGPVHIRWFRLGDPNDA